jgi:hypothetical protein
VNGGLATAGGSSTLTDSNQSWAVNAFANYWVNIIKGTGAGQWNQISSNTTSVLTMVSAWNVQPDNTSQYYIYSLYPVSPPIDNSSITINSKGQLQSSSGAVSSVFGRTGAVVASSGDYSPTEVGFSEYPIVNSDIAATAAIANAKVVALANLSTHVFSTYPLAVGTDVAHDTPTGIGFSTFPIATADIANAAVTEAKVASSLVDGATLSGGAGTALSINLVHANSWTAQQSFLGQGAGTPPVKLTNFNTSTNQLMAIGDQGSYLGYWHNGPLGGGQGEVFFNIVSPDIYWTVDVGGTGIFRVTASTVYVDAAGGQSITLETDFLAERTSTYNGINVANSFQINSSQGIFLNATAATSGTALSQSGITTYFASYWNGSASVLYGFDILTKPDSTTPSAHLSIRLNNNGTPGSDLFVFDQAGNLKISTGKLYTNTINGYSSNPIGFASTSIVYNMACLTLASNSNDNVTGAFCGQRGVTLALIANADGTTARPIILQTQTAVTAGLATAATRIQINAGAAQGSAGITVYEPLTLKNIPAFVASDKYLVVDASGDIHVSALGPAS